MKIFDHTLSFFTCTVLVARNGSLFDFIFLMVEIKSHNLYEVNSITLYFANTLYSSKKDIYV